MSHTFIMIWIEDEEKWYYFKDSFDDTQFKDGHMEYYIVVDKGVIIEDSYNFANKGKEFATVYDIKLWNV